MVHDLVAALLFCLGVLEELIFLSLQSLQLNFKASEALLPSADMDDGRLSISERPDADESKQFSSENISLTSPDTSPRPSKNAPSSNLSTYPHELEEAVFSPVSNISSENNSPLCKVSFPGDPDFAPYLSHAINTPSFYANEYSVAPGQNDLFNPFQLTSRELGVDPKTELHTALLSEAVELTLECHHLGRTSVFGSPQPFAAIFVPAMVPGEWVELDRTEMFPDMRSPRFVKKIRIPAATEIDRTEKFRLALFEGSYYNARWISLVNCIGMCELSMDFLLSQPQMTTECMLRCVGSNRIRGAAIIALDMIRHVENESNISFDFGFEPDAPNRNRVFYIISRALQKGRWSPVYKSEVRTKAMLQNFETATLTTQELTGGNENRLIRIELFRFYKNNSTVPLGFCQTSLRSLKSAKPKSTIYWWPFEEGLPGAKAILEESHVGTDRSNFVIRLCSNASNKD